MILTKDAILNEIRSGRIKISPFSRKSVGPASIDLALDSRIRVFRKKGNTLLAKESTDYRKFTKTVSIKKGYLLKPNELILGITKEKITLPENICGWLNSRSRFARLGLMSHITAPFIAPGVSNKQVLEIFNAGNHNLKLMPGAKICQLILQQCKGKAKYSGRFRKQLKI